MTRQLISILVAAALGISGVFAGPPPSKLSKDLQTLGPNDVVDVIIQFTTVPTSAHYNKVHAQGGIDKAQLHFIKAAAFTLPAYALNALAQDPDVTFISRDRKNNGFLNITAPTVNAPTAWQAGLGSSAVGVALTDSGIKAAELNYAHGAGPGV